MAFFDGLDKFVGIGGLAGGLATAFGGNSTKRKQQALFRNALNETRQAQAMASQQDARALQALLQGFGDSRAAIRAGAESARTAAGRGVSGMKGKTALSAFDRGLVGTSAGTAVTSAADRRGTEAMSNIDSQLAALEAQLFAQQGQAVAAQRGNMANRTMQGGRDLAELFGSVQIDDQRGALINGLFGLAGNYFGGRK